ncbi:MULTISPECIES: 2-oxoacid:acceptor oxidoreductase family protein [unclassified Fusibacter]|uniref:2-oxoacid:acceptor oxidoreductase family protein n=1 Tax=unclassified Fusibacter TaxID=2624464 RepID=UPI0010134361|nr:MULTISPECIES: 2-oxoacid:acceptor oxidoreductase family protein [unclassified Fusibacter]MCK8058996.1 2-oxoacid:acceptor oxidoreductase family protein [Fusibacter sp. A2]NPE22407.1 2-oxoacid:acceptor oxidoreductase family protein [Fusibacter sp. A1]RXV60513.1 2-oxoacid:ferredoxin oxidoreductase subunit gamma [Fusibacter sp. A1]
MMDKIVIAGFGGQGVMFLGKVLAYTGMDSDLELCWIPSYGPEMRGGTANCSVILSDEEIHSPVIDQADAAIVMNMPAYEKFAPKVRPGGVLIVNSSLADIGEHRDDITVVKVPATDLANELGSPSIGNMICLGALLPHLSLVDSNKIEKVITKLTGKRPEMLQVNLAAIEKGMSL